MLRGHVPLYDQIEKFFHGAFATLVYLSACCTHEETLARRMSFATTLLACQSLPAPLIIVSGRSTMGTRLRSSATIVSIPFTIVLLPGAVILVRFFVVRYSSHANPTTIHILIGSKLIRFQSAGFDSLADRSHRPGCLQRHQI